MTSKRYTYRLRCHGQRSYETYTNPDDFQAPLCPSCGHPQSITGMSSADVERPDYSSAE